MILPKLQLTGKTHVEPKQTQILELETADTYKKHLETAETGHSHYRQIFSHRRHRAPPMVQA